MKNAEFRRKFNFWGLLVVIASQENILLGTVSIFYSLWVCVRQISHVRNEGNSENSTSRDWWFRDFFDLTHLPLFRPSFLWKQINIFLLSKFIIKKVRRKNFILEQIAPKHENFLKVVVFLSKFLSSKNKNKYFKPII